MADLIDSEERYRSLLTAAPDMVVRFDVEGRCTATSEPAWLRHGPGPVLDALDRAWAGTGRAVLADGRPRTVELAVHADHDDQFLLARLVAEHQADGSRSSVLAVVSDLTAHRVALAQLDYERRHDALTGLVNRTRFLEGLEELARAGRPVALAIADLDDFLAVNDRFGHERGDAVLRDVAERLQRVAGPEAIVGRLGADQFAVAIAAEEESASALGSELVRALRIPVVGDAGSFLLTGSVGMALGAGAEPRALLRDADAAMSAAKEDGRDRLVLLDDARRDGSLDRRSMLTYLRVCLANHDLVVHYQPIVDLTSREVLNLEALVRLPDLERGGLIFPASFIPLAEESGLDVELGAQVLDRALGDLARIPRGSGQAPLTMSVNITARQLALPDYVGIVVAACERHGVDPNQLCLELTETLVMADPDSALGALRALRATGISIALDDFGVGYSSILYLQRFPVDILKIDRAFVAGLPDDADGRAIVRLVVSLADALGLRVTVEGIETEAQRAALIELGCPAGQGFLFARPAPISDLPLLTSGMAQRGGSLDG
jgi:diguanylate cyclase (GGDEF)-like protein